MRPTMRRAYCTLIFRCACVMAMMEATTITKNATMATNTSGFAWAEFPAVGTNVCHAWIRAAGRRATMPMVMMSEMPLPMPRSVIWSPSHISSMVPAVSVMTEMTSKPRPGFATRLMPIFWMVVMMPGRKGLDCGFSKDFANRYP